MYLKSNQRKQRTKYVLEISLIIISCVIFFPFAVGIYPTVRFTQEQIDVHVFSDYIVVKGLYVYENPFPFPVAQGLIIPFKVGSDNPLPVHIEVKQIARHKKTIPIRYMFGKHRFDLKFSPKEKKVVAVSYRQQAFKQNACYLLTTTKPWRRPLTEGLYRLISEGVSIVTSNYPLTRNSDGIFIFSRKNFMPEEDWRWKWQEGKK